MGKGSKERVVPFGEATRQALLAYVSKRGNIPGQRALFVGCYGDPLSRHGAHRLVSECGKRAGVSGPRCSPHTFRHTCAVMFLRNGGDAFSLQKLLGHADLAMTRRYCELAQADVVAKHRACSPGDRFLGTVRGAQGRKRLR
jgi:integrase/recombinase XerD